MTLITSKEEFNKLDLKKLAGDLLLGKKDKSAVVLVAANLVPLFGVLLFEWNLFSVIFLYWAENLVIGFYNIFKIALAEGSDAGEKYYALKAGYAELPFKSKVSSHGHGKSSLVVFFCFHYGIFTLGHGAFVYGLFGIGNDLSGGLFYTFILLLFSHGFSFFQNYIGKKEYLKASPERLFMQPYGRILIMHFVILAGGFVSMALGSPVYALLILILLKTVTDLFSHVYEHNVYEITDPKMIEEAKKAFRKS